MPSDLTFTGSEKKRTVQSAVDWTAKMTVPWHRPLAVAVKSSPSSTTFGFTETEGEVTGVFTIVTMVEAVRLQMSRCLTNTVTGPTKPARSSAVKV